MDAVDSYIPTPERAIDKPFLMPVEDVFGIKGRGTVATGRIERGIVKVGDEVELVGVKPTRKIVVTGVEMFKKLLDEGQRRRQRGLPHPGHRARGDRARPGPGQERLDQAAHQVQAQVYVLTKEEGGRHTPFYNGYRPQFYLRTTDVTGAIGLPDGAEMIMPGDNVEMTVELITPIALEVGQRFAIREGGRTVGAGAIVSIAGVGTTWPGSKRVPRSSSPAPSARSGRTRRARTRRTIPTGSSCRNTARAAGGIHFTARRSRHGPASPQGCSSIGRALVSKTSGCRFESYRPCHTTTEPGEKNDDVKRLRRYFDEVWSELKKVSWPTREQVRNLTVLVFAISFVVGLYITVLDQIFQGLLGLRELARR